MTRPIIPDGRQRVAYPPTRVLTEFFRWAPRTALDGIALRSSQTGKKTFVLFVDAEQIDSTGSPWVAPPPLPFFYDEGADPAMAGPILTMDDARTELYTINRTIRPKTVGFRAGGSRLMTPSSIQST
jgi:hypothetical protein